MEKVYVENDWYDGPRNGVAYFNGSPHRFIAHFDDLKGYSDTFSLFPISEQELKQEIEQWSIFVEWNKKYEAGEIDTESHPGHGGINRKWDELEKSLSVRRKIIPESAMKAKADFESNNQINRYTIDGPAYVVTWKILNENT